MPCGYTRTKYPGQEQSESIGRQMDDSFPCLWVTVDTDGLVKCLTWADLDDIRKGRFNQRGSQVKKEDEI